MDTVKRYNALLSVVVATATLSWQAWMIWNSVNHRFDMLEKRMEKSLEHVWTVDMQNQWAFQVAKHNTNNWIPNPYTIWQAVKEGKIAPGMRVTVDQGRQYE